VTADREERERQRARDVVLEARARSRHRNDSFAGHREVMAALALNVLKADHRAFMAAIGRGDVAVELSLTDQRAGESLTTFWPSATKSYTDFSKIVVRVPAPPLRVPLRNFVISVRGVLHHESGHVRFTIPLPELWDRALPALRGRERGDLSVSKLRFAWNCLEDQRMEAAVVRAAPRIATYFTPMVLAYVLADTEAQGYMSGFQKQAIDAMGPWLAVAGRDYLPNEVRAQARDDFDEFGQQFDMASDDWFDIVARYLGADDEADMLLALFEAHDFLERLFDGIAADGDSGQQHLKTMSMMQTKESLAKKLSNTSEQHQQMTDSQGNDPSDGSTSPQRPQDRREVGESKTEMKPEIAGAEIDEVLSRINDRFTAGTLSSPFYTPGQPMLDQCVAAARLLSYDIREALESFRTKHLPVWLRHQETGYLDAVAFRTREPGERTYHREPRNYDMHGLGLHVSFLADRSGSMWHHMTALSQTMWAVKTACDAADIPNTMVLWSDPSQTVRVMETNDRPMVYDAGGGTNPIEALNDLITHVADDELHHLVFMFTDGDWNQPQSLTEWQRPDRTLVLIGLRCTESISNKDADVVIPITSIEELGAVVKGVLTDYLESI
jgi:hypothetical protein